MAHGGLSSGSTDDTLRTATGETQIGGGNTVDNFLSLEASEDRYIRAVYVQTSTATGEDGFSTVEVSRSSQSNLVEGASLSPGESIVDETSSGTLAFTYSKTDSTNGWGTQGESFIEIDQDTMTGNVIWEEGEEINLHGRNSTTSAANVRVIVYYERISDC